MKRGLLSYAAWACAMSMGATSWARATDVHCPSTYPPHSNDPREAVWNPCWDPEDEVGEDAGPCADAALAPPARVGSFQRILAVPTGELDVLGDRVAVADDGGVVWVLTDRARTRLAPPKLVEERTFPLGGYTPRFDPKDGSLVLLAHGITAWCGGSDGEWRWRWHGGWTLESDPFKPSRVDLASLEPQGSFPELPGYGTEWESTKRRDGMGRFWLVGARGAYIYDRGQWWQVADAPSSLDSMAVQGKDRVWLSSRHGLYRVSLQSKTIPVDPPRCAPLVEVGRPASPGVGAALPEIELAGTTVQRVSLEVRNGAPLTTASYVVRGPGRTMHFVTPFRVAVLAQGVTTQYARVEGSFAAQPLAFAQGDSWLLSHDDVIRVRLWQGNPPDPVVFRPEALAMTDDTGWLVTCRPTDPNPAAMKWDGTSWNSVPEFPRACYRAVTLGGRQSAWLVGGLRVVGSWPAGDGILVHAEGDSVQAYRIPEGALLSVAALSSDEVYAGGYDGLLVHRQGSTRTVFRVAGDPWILGLTTERDLVAVVGEGLIGVLQGKRLLRVPARLLPAGTWRSAAFDGDGGLWVVGDPGIVRVALGPR
jgi:hypothetical protein